MIAMSQNNNNTPVEYNHPHFINTPYFVLQDDRLDFFNKFLFSVFWGFYLSGKKIKASNGYLASLFKVSERYIQERIKELEDKGFIRRQVINYRRVIEVLHIAHEAIETDEPGTEDLSSADERGTKNTLPRTTVRTDTIDNKKEDTKDKNTPCGVDNFKGLFLSLENLTADNPHNIDSTLLNEWLVIRKKKKAPLTATAWNRTNKVLARLVEAGLNASDCFERMVASGWQGMEFRYFEQDLKQSLAQKSINANERAATELEIRERERKAEEQKQWEIARAKQDRDILNGIKSSIGFAEAKKKVEQECERMGMNTREYHMHIMKNTRSHENRRAM
jgi:DNA-binding Lrp family transcriptional regulator